MRTPPKSRISSGHHPRMIEVYKLVGQAASTRATVLIRGESGTGKELVARAIHANSSSASEPFVPVNCASLPSTLLESELFGHVRGAFTGAHEARRGRFSLAGRGSIFLDEIGDTTTDFQSKLLRVIQNRELQPVGAERAERTEARVIAATHQDLEQMVAERRFREDLYYRLRVVEIIIPPLRDRADDIPLLARHMVERASKSLETGTTVLSDDALDRLIRHNWPGNVRELENCVMRAVVIASGSVIRPEHLSIASPRQAGNTALGSLERQRMTQPPLEFAAAAPITPYVDPFRGAGRVSYAAIGIVALFALILTTVLTTRLSTSLGRLVGAAEAVAGGELTRKAEPSGPAEVRHLARSFNTMTESLRRSIAELAERRSLAAVGEFATALSHEVRNALTSVQLDLERVDERSEDAKNRELVSRTLTHVRRLDAAVTGSLRIARSGIVAPQRLQIARVLDQVVGAAEPIFARADTVLAHQPFDESIVISGDVDALHQLFLNLLLNAQQALSPGGRVDVSLAARDSRSIVTVADTGRGMTTDQAANAFEPYYTTRPNGTGIGLTIARQIAAAHGGELAIQSTPGRGTTVTVSIPIVA